MELFTVAGDLGTMVTFPFRGAFTLLLVLCLSSYGVESVSAQESEAETPAEVTSDSETDIVSEEEKESDASEDHSGPGHSEEGDHSTAADHGSGEVELHNDPTHGNMSDDAWALLEFRSDMALFSAIVFLLLLAGLIYQAWNPIMEALEKREKGIADNIASAEKAAADAEAKLAEYETKLASANEEAAGIVASARKDAEATGQKLVAEAQEDATRLRERATADIESAKRVALSELTSQSTDIAMSLAQRVVGREVKAEDHQGMIKEMLDKLPSDN